MSVYKNIDSLLSNPIHSLESIQGFLNTKSIKEQRQLIDVMYLGRDHIHEQKIRDENLPIESNRQEHIPRENFATILHEKSPNLNRYYEKAIECSRASEVDLNNI